MPVIGLTGLYASGKSHIAEIFKGMGAKVQDSDKVSHQILEESFDQIAKEFPNAVQDNSISRKKLGEEVFSESKKLKTLEAIIHPKVRKRNLEFIEANKNELVVLEIPLLFETKAEAICDYVVFVNVSHETQNHRALARPGMTPKKLQRILDSQTKISVKDKIARSHFVIENNPTDNATAQVKKVIETIGSKA